ncbi:MAG: class I SAM-dependent methyltransferase [Nitrospinota bacterium]
MTCPLCSKSAQFFLKGENREYHLCNQCGLIFVPPQFHISPDSEKARYQEHENSLDNKGYVDMFMEKVDLIKKHCPPLKTALDFGCGYEPVLKTLLEREGLQTDIYDPYFFPEFPGNKTYDLVVSTETFEHLKNPSQDIQLAGNCVAPSGFLAIMTRFYPLADGKPCEKIFSDWYYKRDPTHITFYTSKSFEWIAEQWGFKIIFNNQFDFVLLQKSSLPK